MFPTICFIVSIGFTCIGFGGLIDSKRSLRGWIFLAVGVMFNGIANIIVSNWIAAIVSFLIAYLCVEICKKMKKEYEMDKIVIKQKFLKDLKKFEKRYKQT